MIYGIATIRDILSYHTGEQLDEYLDFLAEQLGIIEEKEDKFSEEDFEKLYKKILETGLSTLPNTQKAIDKYGE